MHGLKRFSCVLGIPRVAVVKNLPAVQVWVQSLCWEVSPGEGNGFPLRYSCLENSTDRGAWWATVHGVAKSQTQLSNWRQSTQDNISISRIMLGMKLKICPLCIW